MCRQLIETVHEINRLCAATPCDERMVGRLEERIFAMTDAIHRRQRELYLREGIALAITHTEEGLPIRVNRQRKLTLWGAPNPC